MTTNLEYKGQLISQRQDGYVNATQMAKANGKRVRDWTRLDATNDYINHLSAVTQIPASELVITVQGFDSEQGTWIHPKLAVELGRWVSVEFAVWCDTHIKTLMETGSTTITQTALPANYIDALKALVASEEEKEKAQLALTAAQPLISYAEADDQNHAGTSLGAFGVIFSQKMGIVPPLGRRKAFALARELGVIQKAPSNIPYQTFINRGYFLVGQNRDGWTYCRLTKSGMIWLLRAAERNQFQQHDPTEVWIKPMHQRGLNLIEREQKTSHFIAGGGKPTQSNIAKFLDITTDGLKKYVRRHYVSWNQFLDLVNPEEVR